MLQVDFGALEGLARSISRAVDDVERALDDLEGQVRALSQTWTGAAAEGFRRTQADCLTGAGDLRSQLSFLHDLVTTAHANHSQAVSTNTAIWRV